MKEPLRIATTSRSFGAARAISAANPAVLSGQSDQTSYLSGIGNQAADRLEQAMASLVNSKEFQRLPHLEQLKQLASRRESIEEAIRHDLILQAVPEE